MRHCPACRARHKGDSVCARCGADLTLPLRSEQQATEWLRLAVRQLLKGNRVNAEAAIQQSLLLNRLPLADSLDTFLKRPGSLDGYQAFLSKQKCSVRKLSQTLAMMKKFINQVFSSIDLLQVSRRWRQGLHQFVPAQYNNVFGLAKRLITSNSPEAWSAMLYAVLGMILTPLDLILQKFEQRLYQQAKSPRLPQIFVCGAPRSGTTLTAQVLIKHLPVFYFNNLTSLFPRSPITASKLFSPFIKNSKDQISFKSFYGRTTHLSDPNDALYFWDRWIGKDRTTTPQAISADQQEAMAHFFAAFEDYSKKPLLAKNNNLNIYAHLVGEVLDTAYFICLDRDPVYLAQSHLIARMLIHGDKSIAYGIRLTENGNTKNTIDPLEDICRQVLFNKQWIKQQQEKLGEDRFIIVHYEDFCANPAKWVAEISARILGTPLDIAQLKKSLTPFPPANVRKVDEATFLKIKEILNTNLDNLPCPVMIP